MLDWLSNPSNAAVIAVVLVALFGAVAAIISMFVGRNREDPRSVRVGIGLLGLTALLCVLGLVAVNASPPTVPGTAPKSDTPAGTPPEGETTTTDALASSANQGLAGQIVAVLGTLGAAAVGGIAGYLTQKRDAPTTDTARGAGGEGGAGGARGGGQ